MKRPEITWSIMHPTALDTAYMRRLIQEVPHWECDSFEICAACHTMLGGLDGLVLYEDYPEVASTLDRDGILANREKLREILALAHSISRPVYYWHREVTVWPAFMKVLPALLDANGEFNLLGNAYEQLLRYKLARAFEAVPELDGIVLTLTEADFSAIHNSTPDVYPPDKVVKKVVCIFAEEHQKRGKRFILRSFGSIEKDYQDILAGAVLASKRFGFEVETKITPYDFDPFLPDNPFLHQVAPGLTLGAECDCEGEFLGFGNLPAENVENIVRFVRYGQTHQVNRYAIRLDRMGNTIFDSYPINLYAYQQAILHPELTAEDIRAAYAAEHYPKAAAVRLNELGKLGFQLIEKLLFIDHHVMFHQNPPQADLKWIRAGGLFALFAPKGTSLEPHTGIWSILPRPAVGMERILQEKEEGLALAQRGIAMVEELKPELELPEYQRLHRLWHNGLQLALLLKNFVRVICAYVEAMPRHDVAYLDAAIRRMADELQMDLEDLNRDGIRFNNGMDHHVFALRKNEFKELYTKPLLGVTLLLKEEFEAEAAARQEIQCQFPKSADFVIAGGIFQDWRCRRNMHASHASLLNGRPARYIGNPVFPNGFVEIELTNHGTSPVFNLRLTGVGICQLMMDHDIIQTVSLDDGLPIRLNHPILPGMNLKLRLKKCPAMAYPALQSVVLY